jgi:hypothetical protein
MFESERLTSRTALSGATSSFSMVSRYRRMFFRDGTSMFAVTMIFSDWSNTARHVSLSEGGVSTTT